ncbi:MAG: helix-turn-helix domain-containing protein [Thermodesulfovibrionales bacterium]|nr:helix-turn-helix domain-containing protein [Thermodesulfovibrionales bacterium]
MIKGSFMDYINEQMKNPEFKEAWDNFNPELELLKSFIEIKEKKGLTQSEIAKRMGTKQPALSRLQKELFENATISTLKKLALALDARLIVKFQTKQ